MKHSILILAHNNFDYLSDFIDFFDDDFFIYIHIDKKSPVTMKEIEDLYQKKNVRYISRKYKINWGGCNVLKAELLLLKKAVEDGYGDYYHFISGQDYPVVSLKEFKIFFNRNKGKEFLEYTKLPRKDWDDGTFQRLEFFLPYDLFNVRASKGGEKIYKILSFQRKLNIRRKTPFHFETLYGGSAWFSLSKTAAEYVALYMHKHPSLLRRLNHTFAPDEVYILSIIMNSHLKLNVVNNNLRYIFWYSKNGSTPAFLDETDYYRILASGCLFARKIEPKISRQLIEKLKVRISI